VKILKEGVHSGKASGVVPSSFRILRQILDRIEDPSNGHIKIPEFYAIVPAARVEQISRCAEVLGNEVVSEFQFVEGAGPVTDDVYQQLVNRSWMPTLSVTGVDGIPHTSKAGNVLRTHTTVTLSMRLPPALDPAPAVAALKRVCEANPPYGAQVVCDIFKVGAGWESPALAEWVGSAMDKASNFFLNKPANFIGEGGSIPFMGMLGQKFPQAQFVITGVLGPETNAHGPNEFLPIDFGSKITSCVASIVADHHAHFSKKQ
jgi:acetylornithine deacetylase/succinyl-diaminopimelate desuccinylase-like protein